MATFLQTQRGRLRDHLKQRWAKTGIKTPIDGTRFCSKCRQVSAELEELIDRGFDGRNEYWREHGDYVADMFDSRRKECGLCSFLTHMFETGGFLDDRRSTATEKYHLYIGSAKEQYGISKDFSHIPESLYMWVRPRQRRSNRDFPPLFYHSSGPIYRFGGGIALEVSSDPGKIGGRLLGPHADFELVKSWFDDCTLHHGTTTCQTDASILQEIPGLRVIDCLSLRLVSWSQLPKNQDRDYVALSYVWGTKSDDENDGNKDISDRTVDWPLPSKLPPLIEDTITAVIKLGFRYLWIDRYCIPQGDQEAKHTQIENMDSIYGSASLTIIAATAIDPSHGLPGVSLSRYGHGRPDKNPPVSVTIGSRTFVTVDTSAAPSVLSKSMWSSRAWTMQEAFLSCRCLVFLDDGTYFQCSSPRSHRFEAIHEPSALLKFKHEVLSTARKEDNSTTHRIRPSNNSLILTKGGKAGDLKLGWCLQLVKDYSRRSMTFESDTLNAFSGILKYLRSLPRPVYNLWGMVMLPEVIQTSSGQRIRYDLVCSLAWNYLHPDRRVPLPEDLEGPSRKEMFPSWTWADWRFRNNEDGLRFEIGHLVLLGSNSRFTSLVDLSVELDDGRIVPWGPGYDSDVRWLTALPNPPRILHIQGYTANPQSRYITEEGWAKFNEQTIFPTKEAHAQGGNGRIVSKDHSCFHIDSRRWTSIDADGQHLKIPFEKTYHNKPWCWRQPPRETQYQWFDCCWYAYHRQSQRENQADNTQPYPECTIDYRAILLGYNQYYVFYMMLIKAPGTDSQTETFERVNVLERSTVSGEPAEVEQLLAKLTGKHAESYPGTPWVKMNTRIA